MIFENWVVAGGAGGCGLGAGTWGWGLGAGAWGVRAGGWGKGRGLGAAGSTQATTSNFYLFLS